MPSYKKYKEYCSTEVLAADERKIFGSTTKGEIMLTYEKSRAFDWLQTRGCRQKGKRFFQMIFLLCRTLPEVSLCSIHVVIARN